MRYLILSAFLFSAVFISCSKEDKPVTQQNQQKVQNEESDSPADTNLTPEEKFSSSILIDFLGDSDDEDLGEFLETEIFKMGANYNGASVVEITPSTWLVSLEKDGNIKNYLLQRYVDFKTNDYYFSMKETSLTLTDVISRSKPKTSAGE
ncbi:MAG: hypothetical protein JNK43_11730 [Ignavibacteria bacterium]|nr:hypothetical protein [Ignavibacteria bacterium]